ncbi:MAG: hypothetical protein GC192_11645 [Bacteroidetes bacterium]|nr:hypothetical protein [Bacteroidota bacterium]
MSKIKKALDAKIKMFKALVTLYLTYNARFDVVTAMTIGMTSLQNRNDVIDDLMPLATEDTKPITQQRDALRTPLYMSAVVVAKAVVGYAASINNVELQGDMNWTVSKLRRLPLDQLGPKCDYIFKKGESLLVPAGPHGLDQAKLDKLEDDYDAWIAKESATRNKQVAISQAKQALEKNIGENMKLVKNQLDNNVYTLSETDPELVGLWNQTRNIVDFPSTTTQAKVTVKDKVSKLFIYQAEVKLVNGVVNSALTDVDGLAVFVSIKQGLFLFQVNAPGYKPYEVVEQRLYKGRINRLEVELEPVD